MHHSGGNLVSWCLFGVGVGAVWLLYLAGVRRQWKLGRHWSGARTAAFSAGMILLGIAFAPPFFVRAHADIRFHMWQHLLIGMVAPVGLVLGAPLSLVLRSLRKKQARQLFRALRSRPLRVLCHPVTALVLNVGGMYLLYLTPVFRLSQSEPAVHHLVHFHFLVAGYLFVWSIIAQDRGAPRAGFGMRLGVLFVAMATHAMLGKLMYARLLPAGTAYSPEALQSAAQIMYYGGDFAELLVAVVLFAEGRFRVGGKRLNNGRSRGRPLFSRLFERGPGSAGRFA